MRQLIAPFAVLALAAACAHVEELPPIPITPPTLRFESFTPEQMDAYGVTLAMQGRIDNPNTIALPVEVFTYEISMEGRRIGAGRATSGVMLPAQGQLPVTVPVRLEWARVPRLLDLLATHGGEAPCDVSGVALVPSGRRYVELPYAVSGTVALPRPPKVSMDKVVVRESNLFETVLEVRINVENPNKFPLPNGRLAYDLSLSGVSVVDGGSYALTDVPPGQVRSIAVPVRFSTVGAAAGAITGALRGAASVSFSGRAGYGGIEVGLSTQTTLVR